MKARKPNYVTFGEKRLEQDFGLLKEGRFQDKQLHEYIERAIKCMKNYPSCGTKIPRNIWPKAYMVRYMITNLWKYDLPNGWRLIYTIKEDNVMILNVILEWFNHKGYERRFHY